jgi:TPR repeat protein
MKKLIAVALLVLLGVGSYFILHKSKVDKKIAECNSGKIKACFEAGLMYSSARGGAGFNKLKARYYLEKSCSKKHASSCWELGKLYLNGSGTKDRKLSLKKNIAKALDYYNRACDLGKGYACYDLSNLYTFGHEVPNNKEKALSYADKACKNGVVSGCLSTGYSYLNANNIVKAEEIFKTVYNQKDYSLKLNAAYGLGLVQEKNKHFKKAIKYYAQACSKVEIACCKMVNIYDKLGGKASADISSLMKNSDIYRTKCKKVKK